jgi:hypothetical protein
VKPLASPTKETPTWLRQHVIANLYPALLALPGTSIQSVILYIMKNMQASSPQKSLIIYAPDYDEFSGGNLCLYYIANTICSYGLIETYIYSEKLPSWCLAKQIKRGQDPFQDFTTIENTLVLYPEIIDGNPLKAKHVARWLLNRPGFFGNQVSYEAEDLIFYFSDYVASALDIEATHLATLYTRIYEFSASNQNEAREGTCYIIRKGFNLAEQYPPKKSWHCLDDYPSSGGYSYLRDCFQRFKYFVSYDHATYLSTLAAISGCISIIQPSPFITADDWRKLTANYYGIAYGFDNLDHAIATKGFLINQILGQEVYNRRSIYKFLAIILSKIDPSIAMPTELELLTMSSICLGENYVMAKERINALVSAQHSVSWHVKSLILLIKARFLRLVFLLKVNYMPNLTGMLRRGVLVINHKKLAELDKAIE